MAKLMIQNKELYNYIINSIKEIRNDMEILKNRFNQIQNALILAKTVSSFGAFLFFALWASLGKAVRMASRMMIMINTNTFIKVKNRWSRIFNN